MRPPSQRLPFEPIMAEAAAPNLATLAQRVGVTPRTVHRWNAEGIPIQQADRAAVAIGSHPGYLWPNDWYASPLNSSPRRRRRFAAR